MKLCWSILFIVFCTILVSVTHFYPLSGEYTIIAPAKLFDLFGANLVTEPKLETERTQVIVSNNFYYYLIPFWLVVNGAVAWLLCKLVFLQTDKSKKV